MNIGLFVTPGNGIIFQNRGTANQASAKIAGVAGVAAPIWLKLEYTNGVTRPFHGRDTISWTQIGSYSKTFAGTYQAGLAAASRSSAPNTSVYSGLSGF